MRSDTRPVLAGLRASLASILEFFIKRKLDQDTRLGGLAVAKQAGRKIFKLAQTLTDIKSDNTTTSRYRACYLRHQHDRKAMAEDGDMKHL